MNTSSSDARSPWSEPDEPLSFLAARTIKRQLLEELSEPSGPTNAELADLLGRWPTETTADSDVAGLLFEDFRNRSQRGESVSRAKYEQKFPEHSDSLASLFRRQDFLRTVTWVSDPSMPTLALPKIGDELFGYRLHKQLGQGAFAKVFLAEQLELAGRFVALKISDLTGSEPQTLAQLQHTNIVPIYSVHEDTAAGIRAVCMPYFGGASLSQVLHLVRKNADQPACGDECVKVLESLSSFSSPHRGAGPGVRGDEPPPPDAPSPPTPNLQRDEGRTQLDRIAQLDFPRACAWIIARLADGLQHAHDRGVLHRDIKPSNILIGGDGTPMLLDFNLSRDANQAQADATLGGTVAYMAPEHLRALTRRTRDLVALVDERSDLYGLGMVLFEMITGHNPFDQSVSHSPMPIVVEAMAMERARTVPSLREYRPDVPWGLESIVCKCLQPDPAQRYQRASELAEDLDRFLDDRPLRHAPELSRVEQIQKWTRRHPKLASSGLIAVGASLLLSLGGWLLLGTQARLAAAQTRVLETEGAEARELLRRFNDGTLKALCLVNTHSDLRDHAEQGRQVCEETLSLFGILDDPNWQDRPLWKRLTESEQSKLAEDAHELLLLLANADCQNLESQNANLKPQISDSQSQRLHLLDLAESIPGLPPSAAVCLSRAAVLRELGKRDQADDAERRANELPPKTARDFYLSATARLHGGEADRYERAIDDLRHALQRDPRHYWSWMQKGLCHLEQGEPQLALADFGVCIGLWPEFEWGYFNRAFTLDQLGQKEAAIADYTAALERDPDLLAARQNRGMARLELGQHASALEDFDRLLLAERQTTVLHALRGQALEGLHRSKEADEAFELALSEEKLAKLPAPQQHQLLCSFGFAVSSRRPHDAEQAFARIPSDDPKFPEALYGRGLLAAHTNRIERASELFALALDRRPNFGEARRFRAVLLARMGRLSEAITEINAALQAAPKSGATLYAAACVTALAVTHAPTPDAARQASEESIRFLRQALAQGYGQHAASDDDLKAIRHHPEFGRLPLN